jgi:conjugal transfer/entry exclusion protein
MGHDISGYNKAGEEIAYARFSMGNYNSTILYSLLDASNYYAGVSGSGDSSTFSIQQIEKALNSFNQLYNNRDSLSESDFSTWDLKQILNFIQNCLETAQNEGSVRVCFC